MSSKKKQSKPKRSLKSCYVNQWLLLSKKEKEKKKPLNQQDSTKETLLNIQKEVTALKKLVNGRTSKKRTEALNPSIVKPIPEDNNMGYTVPMDFDSNIAWLEASWKELFETSIPLLRCMENTALSAGQQLYKVELDWFLQKATNLEISQEEQEKILVFCCPVALSWALPG
ncbi:hypothetical protein DSO57_1000426 [Entomophthora muscae]|uniref:Uncharacterized protein n=1 Tax=Entomophthora muscae TaxID=34485 RepID=A0ACC2UJ64_9FUNG|nr:hypothetical protein DSO57_1000426 [Entomophthora muscae]